MASTLILLFHPNLEQSKANAALRAQAQTLEDVEVIDIQALYPDGNIDIDAEVRRLLNADRLVLQFPVRWYSVPPILRQWQDSVLTRMYYMRYDDEGRRLEGIPLMAAATAGNTRQAYSPAGINLFSLTDLLRPLQSMAHRCGLPWAEPFLVHEANRLDSAALDMIAHDYAHHLTRWIDSTLKVGARSVAA